MNRIKEQAGMFFNLTRFLWALVPFALLSECSAEAMTRMDSYIKFGSSTVLINVKWAETSISAPWQRGIVTSTSMTGFLLPDGFIVTLNDECVECAAHITLRKLENSQQYDAIVVGISLELNLSFLRVEDPSFYEGMKGLELSETYPELQTRVISAGYSTHSVTVSYSTGSVARYDIGDIGSVVRGPRISIDLPVNEGQGGSPIISMDSNQVVGVAVYAKGRPYEPFSRMIPSPHVITIWNEIRDRGSVLPRPSLGFLYQSMDCNAMINYFGLDKVDKKNLPQGITASGILVTSIDPSIHHNTGLLARDVILGINGINIENDGNIILDNLKSTKANFLFTMLRYHIGDQMNLIISRQGEIKEISFELKESHKLLRQHKPGDSTRYYIYGGLVFMPFDSKFATSYEHGSIEMIILSHISPYSKERGRELVFLRTILPSKVTTGYSGENQFVVSVNGQSFKNFDGFKKLVKNLANRVEFIEFTFGYVTPLGLVVAAPNHAAELGGIPRYAHKCGAIIRDTPKIDSIIVIDTALAKLHMPNILKAHQIPSDESDL